jgi:hypothetical protein
MNDLEEMLQQQMPNFGKDHNKIYEKHKLQLDQQVKNGQFTDIVNSKDTYATLINNMTKNNSNMQEAYFES